MHVFLCSSTLIVHHRLFFPLFKTMSAKLWKLVFTSIYLMLALIIIKSAFMFWLFNIFPFLTIYPFSVHWSCGVLFVGRVRRWIRYLRFDHDWLRFFQNDRYPRRDAFSFEYCETTGSSTRRCFSIT